MSDTASNIGNSMQALKIESQPLQDESIQNRTPAVSRPLRDPSATRLARIPPLPEDSAHSKRYYFFGWPVTSKWLTNLAVDNNFPHVFAYHTSFDGIRYICWKSGYRYAYPAAALVENGQHFDGQARGQGKDIVVDIIMIFVNKQAYSHRRPTELQLVKLIKIFGSEPRWFKDGNRPQDFDDYEMWAPIR